MSLPTTAFTDVTREYEQDEHEHQQDQRARPCTRDLRLIRLTNELEHEHREARLLAAVAGIVVKSLPDIARYLKIREM